VTWFELPIAVGLIQTKLAMHQGTLAMILAATCLSRRARVSSSAWGLDFSNSLRLVQHFGEPALVVIIDVVLGL
jgi:hypothetical protein